MADPKGERLWRTLPGLVPKNEWEGHLQDMHSHMEGLLRRVHKLEEGGGHSNNQITQLHRKCRVELATERQLAATASRIDVDVAAHREELQQGLEDLRTFVLAQVTAVRADLMREVEQLKSGLRTANKEIRAVHGESKDFEARAAAAFATKVQHEEACHALRCQHSEASAELQAALFELREEKASRLELEDSRSTLASAHKTLEEEHGQTIDRLKRTSWALDELERRARAELAASVEELRRSLAAAQQRSERAEEERDALRDSLTSARAELDVLASTQQKHGEQLRSFGVRHNDLGGTVLALEEQLTARYSQQERNLKELDRRERSSWEQFMLDRR